MFKNRNAAQQLRNTLWALAFGCLGLAAGAADAATATTTTLASSVNPSVVAQNTTLTATVSPSTATGTVTFKDGSTTLGTGTLASGTATLTKSFSTTGSHTLTAVYAGTSSFTGSTSAAKTQTVNAKTNSTTTLASSINPSFTGQSTTLTATVTGTSPSGTVTFKDGTTTLGTGTLSAGVATFSASFSATGSHSLTAVYAGDASNNTSTSAAKTQTVNAKTNTTTTLASSLNPSIVGQSTTLTATVTGASPSGTVTFKDGTTTLGTGTLSAGVATFSASFSTTGSHSLTAVYAGDVGNNTSTSATKTQTVNAKTNTTTTLASSLNPSVVGQGTTLTATVTGTSPSGTVTFKDGTTTLGTGTLSSGTATFNASFSTTGSHSLTAVYVGDASNNTSTSAAKTQTVNAKTNTTTTLASSLNPSVVGQSATLTATVTGASPSGTVTFKDGTTTLGTGTLSSGTATFNASFSTTGSHSLTAVYAGDAVNNTSTSAAKTQTVNAKTNSSTALTSSSNPSLVGQGTTLTATVTGTSPSGTVTFMDGTTSLGTGTLSSGTATFSASFSTTGSHSLTAVYAGDAVNNGSTSAALSQTVNKAATVTTLATSPNPALLNQPVTLTASVSPATATGTVTFKDGSTTLGTGTLNSGMATLSTSFSTTGSHSLTTVYAGDAANNTSTSAALTQTVNAKTNTTTALTSSLNPSAFSQSITLTATVTGASPGGTVTFNDGGTALGTASLSGTTATFTTSSLGAGGHSLTAAYAGDAANNASTSSALTQTVSAKSATTISLFSSVNPAIFNNGTTLSATVAGNNTTGTVTFMDGPNPLGTSSVFGSTVLPLSVFDLSVGTHSLTAVYSGDGLNLASTSAVLTQVINPKTSTSITLASSLNPSNYLQPVTLTATVSGNNPSGSVTFKQAGVTVGSATLNGSTAALTTTALPVGSYSLTAVYAGDDLNNTSTSAAVAQTVTAASTTLALASDRTSAVYGHAAGLTATISPPSAAGSVSFSEGATTLGTAQLFSGVATLTTPALAPVGSHSVTATYAGNAQTAGSVSPSVTYTVTMAPTEVNLTAPVATLGQSVKLSASVSPNTTGTVSFKDGDTVLGSATITAGVTPSLLATFTTVGPHDLTALYNGDANNQPSTSTPFVLIVQPAGTTTTLSASPNPVAGSQSVTLQATITGRSPGGTVTFKDGAATLGSAPVAGGIATLPTSFSSSGTHNLIALYNGDPNNAASTSSQTSVSVNIVATTTSLSSGPNPSLVGQATTLTASVSPAEATGTVTFYDNSFTTLGSAPVVGGTATLSQPFAASGSHSLTAYYAGDAVHDVSTSAALSQVVNKAGSTTVLTSSPNPAPTGQSVTLSATVSPATATGAVSFKDTTTGSTLCTASLSAGTAACSASFSATGAHSLTATYLSDAAVATSTSNSITQTIAASGLALSTSPNPSTLGQSITLHATINGTTPTGTVSFSDGGTPLGTANVSGGFANLNAPLSSVGVHSLSASYAGDANNAAGSASVLQTVGKANSFASLGFSGSTKVNGASTLTATVTGANPSGSVTFADGSTTLGTASLSATSPYTASLPTVFTTAGGHSLSASYAGDARNNGSLASTFQSISLLSSSTALAATPNPAGIGQSVTFSATVSPAGSTGVVDFSDNGNGVGSANLVNGTASFTTSYTSAGSHSLQASYEGNTSTNSSTSATVSLSVGVVPTALTLSSNLNPAASGQSVILSATATPASATGSITFMDGPTTLGTATLNAGVATLSTHFDVSGNHPVTAVYAGNASYGPGTSSVLNQGIDVHASATTLSASPNPAVAGQSVTLVASVSGNAPTGTVSFQDGIALLGTVTLTSGTASLSTSFTNAGLHTLSASYSGDAGNALSSASLAQTVDTAPPPLPAPPAISGPVVNYEYDAQGHLTRTIRAPGVLDLATKSTYDPLYRVSDSTDPQLGVTRFQYDGQDHTTQVTDPRSLVTQSPRDGLGQVTQLTSPDTGVATPTYDEAGNLKTRTDSRGALATNTYDALNRLTQSVFTLGAQTQGFGWGYDESGAGNAFGAGRLTSTTHPSGGSRYAYDELGRLVGETQTVNAIAGGNASNITLTVGYGYDDAGHLTRLTYPSGRQVSIAYDQGQPTGMSLAPTANGTPAPLISRLTFAPFGGPELWHWQLASGLTQAHPKVYDTSGRMVRYRLGGSFRDVGYDAADRISSYTHYDATTGAAQPSLDQGFGYDGNGRLTSITTATASWSIGYDANGNRTTVTLNGSPSTYTTEATSNKLTGITNPARSFGYDNAGNTTSDSAGYTATYDASGRLATITKAGVSTTYSYNGQGQRVRKFGSTGASSTVLFVYSKDGQLLGEYSNTGAALREYVWLDDTPIAMFVPDTVATNPPIVYYFHTDHLNTPRVVTDTAGSIRWRWMAEPFGTTAPETNPSGLGIFTQPLRFPGQYADAESGLFYNYFRNYDSSIGRYQTFDPIGLAGGSMSPYVYVNNNPLSSIDPNGLAGCKFVGIFWVCDMSPPPLLNPDLPPSVLPPSNGLPLLPRPRSPEAPFCKVDDFDKKLCDDNYENDQDSCHEQYGNGLRGGGFRSSLSGCLDHARERWKACYLGKPDPGRWTGGDSFPGGKDR